MTSLIDMVHELDLTLAAITETWFKGGKQLDRELRDIEMAADIKFICKNRKGRGHVCRGGVCLAFRASLANLKERKLKEMDRFEVLCVTGTVRKISRKIIVFCSLHTSKNSSGGNG